MSATNDRGTETKIGHNSGDGYSTIEVRPLSPHVGAEIHGVDLARPIAAETLDEINRAFGEYGVIFFRDQDLTPADQVAFARRFGEIDVNRFFKPVEGHPDVAEVRKEPEQRSNIGGGWHTDHTYDQAPAMGSILYARELPPVGGDTLFASMYAAYESLSDGLKKTLEGLRACHSSRQVFGAGGRAYSAGDSDGRVLNADLATQDAVHPVVIRHPLTGRKALYVNRSFTLRFEGWSDEDSKPLLDYLFQHGSRNEFTCRFHWEPGSLAFWDNRATWHSALNDYHGHRRLLHRVTVAGTPLN